MCLPFLFCVCLFLCVSPFLGLLLFPRLAGLSRARPLPRPLPLSVLSGALPPPPSQFPSRRLSPQPLKLDRYSHPTERPPAGSQPSVGTAPARPGGGGGGVGGAPRGRGPVPGPAAALRARVREAPLLAPPPGPPLRVPAPLVYKTTGSAGRTQRVFCIPTFAPVLFKSALSAAMDLAAIYEVSCPCPAPWSPHAPPADSLLKRGLSGAAHSGPGPRAPYSNWGSLARRAPASVRSRFSDQCDSLEVKSGARDFRVSAQTWVGWSLKMGSWRSFFRLGLTGGGNGPTPGFPPVVAESAVLRGGVSGAYVFGVRGRQLLSSLPDPKEDSRTQKPKIVDF